MPDNASPAIVHLRAAGTSVVVDLRRGMPEVAFWGDSLGKIEAQDLRALVDATEEPRGENAPEQGLRVGIVPLATTGWMGRPGLVGHRSHGRNWSPSFVLAREDVFRADATGAGPLDEEDNSPRPASRPADDGTVLDLGCGGIQVALLDSDAAVQLELNLEIDRHGLLRLRGTLTNVGEDPYTLDELSLALPVPLEANEILDFSGRWERERYPERLPVPLGCHLHEGRHGRTGFDAAVMTFVGPAGFGFRSGEVWGVHPAWSGNHRTWVEKTPAGRELLGAGELLLPGEVELAPGQTYSSPWVYFAHGRCLDDVAHRVHAHLRALPSHPGPRRPVTLNEWEAVHFNQDARKITRLVELAAHVGVERFVLDDGWFRARRTDRAGLGDWYVDPSVWPDGLHTLARRVRALGMEFGLWFEPEMVNPDSDLARAHPDWILGTGNRLPLEWRHQQVLNIAIPEARAYLLDRITALVHEYGIAYIKWDHNRDLIDAGDRRRAGAASVHAQTLAYYRLLDDVRAACPGLEIESCSSGGARIDLGVLSHVQRVWLSDCIDPHERQSIARWTTQLVPLEMQGTHIASARSQTTGRTSDLSFRAGTAIFGHLGIEWDLTTVGEGELAELAAWVSYYKQIRELVCTGDVVRAPTPDPSLWLGGVVSPSQDRALFSLVTRHRAPISPRGRIRLVGLSDDIHYRVRPRYIVRPPSGLVAPSWFHVDHGKPRGIVLTGRMLASSGLQTPLLDPDQVLLLEVEEVTP